ncbi:MAG: EMC3/TMCO1 family protein [Candidatus Thorarchaeota archaeon]
MGKNMDPWSDFIQFFANLLDPVATLPFSAPFILIVSVALALISIWATTRFTDVEKLKADMQEMKEWREKFNLARKTMDAALLQEVQDQQSRMMRINADMMSARMKPMCIYYIPFLIVFAILNAVYVAQPVAILPFNPQDALPFLEPLLGVGIPGSGFGLYFWPWYLLSSLGLGNLIRRASGVGMEMGM